MTAKQEFETIVKICERAEKMGISSGERMTLLMDLENVHQNIGLNLVGLLEADELNFAHDIIGIQTHINRNTKELEDFFVPRYAQQKDMNLNSIIDQAKAKASEQKQINATEKSNIEREYE